ncbi:MAG: hypothetical protein ACUVUU_00700 [bacterium]
MRMRSWKKPVGLAIAGLIIFFIIRNLTINLARLGHYSFEISYTRLFVAFLIVGILFVFYGLLWKSILAAFGNKVSFRQSMRIWFLSQAAKYIPGKVWFALGRVYLCESNGIPRLVAVFATAFEIMLVVASAVIAYVVSTMFVPEVGLVPRWANLLVAGAVVASVHPGILRYLLKKVVKYPCEFRITYFRSLFLLLMYLFTWIGYGIGFYLVSTATVVSGAPAIFKSGNGLERVVGMLGINAAAWVVGFVSLLTPAGLGIREGVGSLLSARILEQPYPNLVPLSARVWITICEGITILLVLKRK